MSRKTNGRIERRVGKHHFPVIRQGSETLHQPPFGSIDLHDDAYPVENNALRALPPLLFGLLERGIMQEMDFHIGTGSVARQHPDRVPVSAVITETAGFQPDGSVIGEMGQVVEKSIVGIEKKIDRRRQERPMQLVGNYPAHTVERKDRARGYMAKTTASTLRRTMWVTPTIRLRSQSPIPFRVESSLICFSFGQR